MGLAGCFIRLRGAIHDEQPDQRGRHFETEGATVTYLHIWGVEWVARTCNQTLVNSAQGARPCTTPRTFTAAAM